MPSTVRETILSNLDTRLKTILTTGGYSTNLGNYVISWQTDPTPLEELNPAEVEYRDADVDSADDLLGTHRHKMKITLEVRAAGSTPIATLRSMEADLHKAIGVEAAGAAPARWGGVALLTEPGRTSMRAEQAAQVAAGLTFEFYITYRTLAWDAFTAA